MVQDSWYPEKICPEGETHSSTETFGEVIEADLEDAGLGNGAAWRCCEPGNTLFD